jgi:hypothetical protein
LGIIYSVVKTFKVYCRKLINENTKDQRLQQITKDNDNDNLLKNYNNKGNDRLSSGKGEQKHREHNDKNKKRSVSI